MLTRDTIDRAELSAAVRTVTDDPAFELLDWEVQTLSYDGAVNPDGLLRVAGHGRGAEGSRLWAVALKVVKRPAWDAGPHDLGYWLREGRAYAALDRLPQIFSHFDYKSRNLFLRQHPHGGRDVIAVDWGDCGFGALGGDLALLVGGSALFLDWEPERVAELDAAAWPAYIAALGDAGWGGAT